MSAPTPREQVVETFEHWLTRHGIDRSRAHAVALEVVASLTEKGISFTRVPAAAETHGTGRTTRAADSTYAEAARETARRVRIMMKIDITGPQLEALETTAAGDVYRLEGTSEYLHVATGENLSRQIAALMGRELVTEDEANEHGYVFASPTKAGRDVLAELAARSPDPDGAR